ncbi:isoprenylcysteine carboxylmethyltransferase family protein [uncultured Croceitalea sp.]|uniref:methyltransferase family protein n=1 Tax=uncultured Croceitalea sp. TaxID=1798908 RepID=UPI0033062D2F
MQLRLPPIVVFLIFAVFMFMLARFLPFGEFDFFGRMGLMYIVWGLAVVLVLLALIKFKRAKTTVDPTRPSNASSLVISGIYSYTRNPMYLAMLLVLIGFGLKLGNAFNTMTAAGFVYYMNHFQIKPEEEALTERFGKNYKLYCKAVRRWF